nr:MAG TPA: hypothetical protein [Caudoviricetes sp.]
MGDAEITWLVRHISLISPLAYVHALMYACLIGGKAPPR